MHKTIKKRIKTAMILLALVFPCIFLRLLYIQVILHLEYSQAASANLDRCRDITPRRGAIYDHHGVMLAKTVPTYDVYVRVAKIVKKKGGQLLYRQRPTINLSKLLNIPAEEIVAKIEQIHGNLNKKIQNKLRKFQKLVKLKPRKYQKEKRRLEHDFYNRPQILIKDISHQAACTFFCEQRDFEIAANQAKIVDRYEGFHIIPTIARYYSLENLAPQLLGHIGAISDHNKYSKNKDYESTDMVGKSGIELLMEEELRGRRGCLVRSRQGKIFAEEPTEGMEVHLTINAALQKIAETQLDKTVAKAKGTGGAAVVIDIYTGAVLVLASSPRYDNNSFSKEYSKLIKSPQHQLVNRAINYYYPIPPGSVFKVLLAIYALEKGIININTTFTCRGYFAVPGRFRCTHRHGTVNVIEAIAGSCNVFFYHIGQQLGPECLAECARIFGFGEKSGLKISEESEGLIPTPEWKKRKIGANWSVGDSRMFGIGQRLEATPIQVARAMAMLATGGSMPELKIIKKCRFPVNFELPNIPSIQGKNLVAAKISNPLGQARIVRQFPIRQRNRLIVLEGMRQVTESPKGTAYKLRSLLGNIRIASKTGTSQVGKDKADHAWFAGFAPLTDPRYAFAVLIEHGGYGGSTAGPVAATIITKIFELEHQAMQLGHKWP